MKSVDHQLYPAIADEYRMFPLRALYNTYACRSHAGYIEDSDHNLHRHLNNAWCRYCVVYAVGNAIGRERGEWGGVVVGRGCGGEGELSKQTARPWELRVCAYAFDRGRL